MEISIITNYTFDKFEEFLDLGIKSFELTIGEDVIPFLEMSDEILKIQKKNNLKISSVGQWGAKRVVDGKLDIEQIEKEKQAIEITSKLGSPFFVTGVNYDDAISKFKNLSLAIDYLKILVEHGEKHGVKICVYNCEWNNYIHSPEQWEYLFDEIPGLLLKYDPSHSYYRNSDYLKEINDWGKYIGHFHLKGALKIDSKRIDDPPVGMDQLDWNSMLILLRLHGYNGALSIEPHATSELLNKEFADTGIKYTYNYIKTLLGEK